MSWQIKADELAKILPLAQLSDLAFAVDRQLLTSDEAQKFIISSLNEQSNQRLFDLAMKTDQFVFNRDLTAYLDDDICDDQRKLWAYIFLSWLKLYADYHPNRFKLIDHIFIVLEFPDFLAPLDTYYQFLDDMVAIANYRDEQRQIIL